MSAPEPDVIPASDREYFDTGESAPQIGWEDRLAVVVVDLSEAFSGERPEVDDPFVEHTASDADRSVISHDVSLFDTDRKYTDGTAIEEARDHLRMESDDPA
ncbi:hypothetical protein [Halodesulfurarchaeum sp.]|uniref:hypothetical protein n=1 Tax=Halodesulfurarchaeum sp. TaxID=1980530 RepID=UPI002FC31961